MELVLLLLIALFVISYRKNDGESVYKFIAKEVTGLYDKYAPYSFKTVREKSIELGEEYTTKQYITQVIIFGATGAGIAYLYFYSIIWAIVYGIAAIAFIPYLAFLRCKRIYSEFLFEQIQVYTTNVIMEFNTTQSFVKALEGVRDSGVLENPILDDVKLMIDLSYQNGTIEESINYFNQKYPYYMVKNMHQLFLQITREGAKDSGESLDNMLLDIDMLVEGVYRDKMDREQYQAKRGEFMDKISELANEVAPKGERNHFITLDRAAEVLTEAHLSAVFRVPVHVDLTASPPVILVR